MHNRRLGALLIGMWVMGSVLAWFVKSQTLLNVDRFLTNAPPRLQQTVTDLGTDSAGLLLRAAALDAARHLQETWGVVQLCLGAALFCTSLFTSNRSRVVILCAALMLAMAAVTALYLTPTIDALSNAVNSAGLGETASQRDELASFQVWRRVLEIFKIGLAGVVVARLLFDRHDLETALSRSGGQRTRSEGQVNPSRARVRQ